MNEEIREENESHNFGGMQPHVYKAIIDFKTKQIAPQTELRYDSILKRDWSNMCNTFQYSDGFLKKNGRYVLIKGEAETILRELHVKTGHGATKNVTPLFTANFFYGGNLNGSTNNDYNYIVSNCFECVRLKKPLMTILDKRWKEVSLKVSVDDSRNFRLSLDGLPEEVVKSHNEHLKLAAEKYTSRPRIDNGVSWEEYMGIQGYLKYKMHPPLYNKAKSTFSVRCAQFMLDSEDDRIIRWKRRQGNPFLICHEETAEVAREVHRMMAHVKTLTMMAVTSRSIFWFGIQKSMCKAAESCHICHKRGGGGRQRFRQPNFDGQQFSVSFDYNDTSRTVNIDWGTIDREAVTSYGNQLEEYLSGPRKYALLSVVRDDRAKSLTDDCSSASPTWKRIKTGAECTLPSKLIDPIVTKMEEEEADSSEFPMQYDIHLEVKEEVDDEEYTGRGENLFEGKEYVEVSCLINSEVKIEVKEEAEY